MTSGTGDPPEYLPSPLKSANNSLQSSGLGSAGSAADPPGKPGRFARRRDGTSTRAQSRKSVFSQKAQYSHSRSRSGATWSPGDIWGCREPYLIIVTGDGVRRKGCYRHRMLGARDAGEHPTVHSVPPDRERWHPMPTVPGVTSPALNRSAMRGTQSIFPQMCIFFNQLNESDKPSLSLILCKGPPWHPPSVWSHRQRPRVSGQRSRPGTLYLVPRTHSLPRPPTAVQLSV